LAGGTDINAQLAQARELETKLEEYRTVRLLRATIAGEASARDERVSELGKQARERINADFNVDDPNTPPRVRQKLIAAATLLRAMLAPSTPEARNLHREVQRSSSRRPCNMPKAHRPAYASKAARGTTTVLRAKRHPSTQTAQRGNQPTRAERRSGSGYLTRTSRLRTATPATSSTPAVRAM
jgi:hypothetical protein